MKSKRASGDRASTARGRAPDAPAGAVDGRVIRLLVIGNHHLIRDGVDAMLRGEPGFAVTGAADAELAFHAAGETAPDAVLLLAPGPRAVEATRQVRARWPGVAVVILCTDGREGFVADAVMAGAAGYLTTDCSGQLLCHAIRAALEGGTLISGEPLRQAVRRLGQGGREPAFEASPTCGAGSPNGLQLTAREMDVLQLLADGCTNKEISLRLHLAVVTVKKYVQSVTGKLGVSDRTQAAVRGVREGLVR